MVSVLYGDAQNLRHVSPQNRFSLKEFESTTREIGLIIFRKLEERSQRKSFSLQFVVSDPPTKSKSLKKSR